MVIERETQMVLSLLSYELFGRELSTNNKDIDWEKLVQIANNHAITALLYTGVKQLQGVPQHIVNRIREAAIDAAMRSERMLKVQQEIVGALNERQVSCAVLKGTSVAYCYPHPELRIPGDVDLLVGSEKMDIACRILESKGFVTGNDAGMHVVLQRADAEVELHRTATRYPNTEKGQWAYAYMEQALQHVQWQQIEGYCFPILGKSFQMISLVAHMSRHLCTCGIGLRQLSDWAITIHRLHECIDQEDIRLLEACGLLRCASIMTHICERYLGLPACEWKEDIPDDVADLTMEQILSMGNFHAQREEEQVFSSIFKDPYDTKNKGSLVFNYICYVHELVKRKHTWVKSSLWLPLFCVYYPCRRLVHILTGKRKTVNVVKSIQIAKARDTLERELELYK